MVWTDLVLKCAQRGHQVMVSQRPTRPECFESCKDEAFDVYMCIDPEAVFKVEDVFQLLESPHDTTGVMMMSTDFQTLTCGKTLEYATRQTEQYIESAGIEPSFLLMRTIPEGWNFLDPVSGHVDTKIRIGNRVTVVV